MKESSSLLQELRAEIDKLDDHLLNLLNVRAALSLKIGAIKKTNSAELMQIKDVSREESILSRLIGHNRGPLNEKQLHELFEVIFSHSCTLQKNIKEIAVKKNKRIAIVGCGRFGTLLYRILQEDYEVLQFDKNDSLAPLETVDAVFLAVPIRQFEIVIKAIAPFLKKTCTVIDTCSVKCYAVDCMKQHLPDTMTLIATHPLFGPDSYYKTSQNKIMMFSIADPQAQYAYWKDYFLAKNLRVLEMTPDEHDRYAAASQGVTHLIGRALSDAHIYSTPIDTLGFSYLLSIASQTCKDHVELFEDMQRYNPYTRSAQKALLKSLTQLVHPPSQDHSPIT